MENITKRQAEGAIKQAKDAIKLINEYIEQIEIKTDVLQNIYTSKDEYIGLNHKRNINRLDLSVRVLNLLSRANIEAIDQLALQSEGDLLKIRGMGYKGIEQIKHALNQYGLKLKRK